MTRVVTTMFAAVCTALVFPSPAAAQEVSLLAGASIGAGFSTGGEYKGGPTGSLAGLIGVAGRNWMLHAHAVELLLVPNEQQAPQDYSGSGQNNGTQCRDPLTGEPQPGYRCSTAVSPHVVFSPTLELGFTTPTRYPLLLGAGYRAGPIGGVIGSITLLSRRPSQSHSYIRLAGGRQSLLLSVGTSLALLQRYVGP